MKDESTPVPPADAASAPSPRPLAGTHERGSSPWLGRASAPSAAFVAFQELERQLLARTPVSGAAVAPATAAGAATDWWTHLLASPAKQWELALLGFEQAAQYWTAVASGRDGLHPLAQDKRFEDPAWHTPPYRWLALWFLLRQAWWQRAMTGVPGVTRHHEQMLAFAARQWLDMVSPSNFIATNPVVQRETARELGMNLLRGAAHAAEDTWRAELDLPPAGAESFQVGRDLAVTPGCVVFRNRLIELIQYTPTKRRVRAEPVLIVPAWIMKYYVLDLSPGNSLVRHLVDQGFTVFVISWKNPGSEDRDLGMDDYDRLGVRAALKAIAAIVPGERVHAAGYCLGGTLLALTAAALGRTGGKRLKTMTLLAAQTDFTDPGELGLFVDESQIAFLENLMWSHGYLDKRQMKGTFQLLRSNDLLWSYRLTHYLLGQRQPVSDLMAWNADGTRMPYRMHVQYLSDLFLRNALAHGEWQVDGMPVNLADIRVPIFNVGAVQDHVAPWRSVFRLHSLTDANQTFVLTAGGHNVGIVNPPGQSRSSYRLRAWHAGDRLLTPDEWMTATPQVQGSWWTPWVKWLAGHSSRQVAPPPMGAPHAGLPPLEAAPGRYVQQR